ncbi:MAG: hypothetical protein AB1734_11060 [Elusimicrobiota bacterium]
MIPSPIFKVLSVFKKQKVKSLLIGGQACIAYGGAEFSRDSDFVVLASPGNLARLRKSLALLKAEPVYFPPLTAENLAKGHASHFRCGAKGLEELRVDVMARLRGCEPFPRLWSRRHQIVIKGMGAINLISLEDLVSSKKTQRDKDWLMLTRLVENDIYVHKARGGASKARWWLAQSRVPETLIGLCEAYPAQARAVKTKRPLLSAAMKKDTGRLKTLLKKEEKLERDADIKYWTPLKKELEAMRLSRSKGKGI